MRYQSVKIPLEPIRRKKASPGSDASNIPVYKIGICRDLFLDAEHGGHFCLCRIGSQVFDDDIAYVYRYVFSAML
jgi:hypothetical protein